MDPTNKTECTSAFLKSEKRKKKQKNNKEYLHYIMELQI